MTGYTIKVGIDLQYINMKYKNDMINVYDYSVFYYSNTC